MSWTELGSDRADDDLTSAAMPKLAYSAGLSTSMRVFFVPNDGSVRVFLEE